MNTQALWYAVYTKPRWEKKVASLLTRKAIENYCPLHKTMKQWHDRKKLVAEPLFTSYVFVHIMATEIAEVKKTDGILNFVYWLGKPAVVRDEEITAIQQFLNNHQDIRLEKIRVNPADTIQIIRGPLSNHSGTVLEVSQKKVKIILPSLGYAMVAELEKSSIEVVRVAPAQPHHSTSTLHQFKIA